MPYVSNNQYWFPMAPEMLYALSKDQVVCICKSGKSVTMRQVKKFLTKKCDAKFTAQFKSEYLHK
jgi:hypothetical protein